MLAPDRRPLVCWLFVVSFKHNRRCAMHRYLIPVASVLFLAGPALADDPPPPDAKPLSEILQQIEQESDFAYFDEVEWEDGLWEIEFWTEGRRRVKMKVDPVSGEAQ